jgi:hypothetical protein
MSVSMTASALTADVDAARAASARASCLEFIGTTAYVVTLTGEVWKIEGASEPRHGVSH